MRAVSVFPKRREIRLIEQPEPTCAGPRDVRIRMREVGVCGTDREIAAFEYGVPPDGADSLILGHESLGEVTEVGPEVDGVRAGDLAVLMVRRPCPHASCVACRAGRQDFCYTGDFTERGIVKQHGFMADVVVDRAEYVVPAPRELRDVAVLAEPLTIAEKALTQIWDIQERLPWACQAARAAGDAPPLRALVLGAGPVALLGAFALRHADFDVVVYSREDPTSAQATIVAGVGGRYLSAAECAPAEICAAAGRFDVVYEATGASGLAFEVLRALGNNAVFAFTGVAAHREPTPIDTSRIMRELVLRNQVVFGTVNAGREAYEAAVRDLGAFQRRWPQPLRALITGRYPPEEHAALLTGRRGGIKNTIAFA